MLEISDDEKCGIYASLSLAIFDNIIPDNDFEDDEELNRMLSQSHQYKAVSCLYTDSPGALDHLKIMIDLITKRMAKWNRTEDAIQLADAYNETAMAYMRENDKEEDAIKSWIQSYDAFGAIPGDPLQTKIRQEWPAVHLALIYALQNKCKKGEDILLPVLQAREEKYGKDSTSSMVCVEVLMSRMFPSANMSVARARFCTYWATSAVHRVRSVKPWICSKDHWPSFVPLLAITITLLPTAAIASRSNLSLTEARENTKRGE